MAADPHVLVSAMVQALRRGQVRTAHRLVEHLAKQSRRQGPELMTAVVEDLAPSVPGLGGDFTFVTELVGWIRASGSR
jgi:hypothetical protein